MRTLDEYRAQRPAARPIARDDPRPIAQELVRLAALTNDPDWDHYNRYVEAAITAAKRHREVFFAQLRDPMLVETAEMLRLKASITAIDARIETLEEVLMLPRMLKTEGTKARVMIAGMERDAVA